MAFGGKQDPLFRKAILQSPAFQALYDRSGVLETTFQNFSAQAGCGGRGLACLRQANVNDLSKASTAIIAGAPPGTFGFGPSTDGTWMRQLPTLELASGNYWKEIDSLIISHVKDEARIFVAPELNTDDKLDEYFVTVFPAQPAGNPITQAVIAQYPRTDAPGSPYTNVTGRDRAFVQDSSFVCYNRPLADAYLGKTYNVQYSRGSGLHGADVSANFFNGGGLGAILDRGFPAFATSYQSYLTSFATSGDPNTNRVRTGRIPTIEWPLVKNALGQDVLGNVLDAGERFVLSEDPLTKNSTCGFWVEAVAALTTLGGYAPPGAVVPSRLLNGTFDAVQASRNFNASAAA
ncbi:hypothetical protein LTS18_002846 [Coniosporium uncinatum]|uniref:Uncharacterized protein n=1 Tax=Coniosporium uncinatum TaxID=93489 RepID=A0ACC3DUG9_9PEZI|nr:hypothetical protein LTS18_002846 [Coniosporium uncinatum]